ncbi:MAG: nucleotidyltransferase domain-containing protein [Lachnospiraceae bacterium]
MEEGFWIQVLQMQLSDNEIIYEYMTECSIQLYLFGSARISKTPNDLDILLIYPDNSRITKALELKKVLVSYLQKLNGIEIHMVLMTVQENEEINFIKKEGAVKIHICRNNK